ncbi:MAG: 4Fe-4S dicluster domain-containing protein [Calditrichaeota bacterium]|nr:4Fe-4S binding protein [Calditrichota bacterium]RQV98864.1 MAG: 4Fe-4S dicluster domain-containing protein [Calditrichota bacterium]
MADLKVNILGIQFPNPIWTAAGPGGASADKLLEAARGGAGALVSKTISQKPARVPIPNISLPFPGSLINAELWSEVDYHRFLEEEFPRARVAGIPIIASVGYSPEDLSVLGKQLNEKDLVDAVEFSIHYVGKDISNLIKTAEALRTVFDGPVLAKFSPSISEIRSAVKALDPLVDGFVAINSVGPALDFDIYTRRPLMGSGDGRGWLSGRAILPIGLHFVATIAMETDKPVIGVGGIRTVEDVIKYIMAGASAVQVCSLAVLKGQQVYGQLAEQLSRWMDKNGYTGVSDLRAAFLKREKKPLYYYGDGTQLYPEIVYEKCRFCDMCVNACIHGAIQFENKIYDLDRNKCVSCGLCVSVCPWNALSMTEYP